LSQPQHFTNTLLTSLPESWSTFITAVNAGIVTLTSDGLIARILEEYWLQKLTTEKTTALKAQDSKTTSATKVKCFNCGAKGHKKVDCWEKGGGKEG
jgi:hypothetical protein